MPSTPRLSFLIIVFLFCQAGTSLAADLFPVASTNIVVNESLIRPDLTFDHYLWGGAEYYLDQILAHPQEAFSFRAEVPADESLYRNAAGTDPPVVGVILYPTSEANDRPGYALPGADHAFPRMQRPGETPLWPDPLTRYPLIINSHGLNTSPVNQLPVLAGLAGRGFIVVSLFHGDSRYFPNDSETNGIKQLLLRPLEASAALDRLETHPHFRDRIDWNAVGAMGHSYGGTGALVWSGAKVANPPSGHLVSGVVDSRVKAAAGMSTFAGLPEVDFFGQGFAGAAGLSRPQLIICGQEDDIAPCSFSLGVLKNSPQTGYHVTLEKEGHSFSSRADIDVITWAATFFKAFLADDREAGQRLNSTGSVAGGARDRVVIFNGGEHMEQK
jgi:hypothetical protein